jgi:hypothetical protein
MTDTTTTEAPAAAEDKQESKDSGGGAVAVQNTGGNALANSDDFFEAGGSTGLEDFSQGDFLVPYVRIVQALSKELQRGHAKYLEGAQNGDFVNSATRKTMNGDKGFYAIPIHYSKRYQAWKPNNGGPAADYGNDSSTYDRLTPNDKGKRIDELGNEVTETAQYFILIVDKDTGDHEIAVLSFGGSQMKKSRQWNSLIASRRERRADGTSVTPAMFFYSYHITSVPESNDQGQWYGFSIKEGPKVPELPNAKEIFQLAKDTRDQITAGSIKAAVVERDHDEDVTDDEAF